MPRLKPTLRSQWRRQANPKREFPGIWVHWRGGRGGFPSIIVWSLQRRRSRYTASGKPFEVLGGYIPLTQWEDPQIDTLQAILVVENAWLQLFCLSLARQNVSVDSLFWCPKKKKKRSFRTRIVPLSFVFIVTRIRRRKEERKNEPIQRPRCSGKG